MLCNANFLLLEHLLWRKGDILRNINILESNICFTYNRLSSYYVFVFLFALETSEYA